MKPEIKDIEITINQEPFKRAVTAGVYGYVAVHRSIQPDAAENLRTLTHVATENAIRTELTRELAIYVAEQIGQNPIWDFKTMDEFESRRPALKVSLEVALKNAEMPRRVPA